MNRFARTFGFFCIFATVISPQEVSAQAPAVSDRTETAGPSKSPGIDTNAPAKIAAEVKWQSITGKWKSCEFGGEGDVAISKDLISIERGDPLTAVRWDGDIMRDNYELKLDARRTEGFDFFCGLTFPIAKEHVTLVLAGWGGGITGISSIDGFDASENETTLFRDYEDNQWYEVRVRVDPFGIQCWVDDDIVAEVARAEHTFGLRYEMEVCEPLGIAAYETNAEYRRIRIRKLKDVEKKAGVAKAKQWADE